MTWRKIAPATALDLYIDAEVRRINDLFIKQAIRQWDKEGEGYFKDWIQEHVAEQWREKVGAN